MNQFKLGKKQARKDPRTLKLSKYLLASDTLPTPPDTLDLTREVPEWQMYGNNKYGDCTWAAVAHLTMLATAMIGVPVVPNEADVVAGYLAMSPGDDGCVILDVLNQWKNKGLPGTGPQSDFIDGYIALDNGNRDHIRLSVSMFAGNDLGFQVPAKIWDMGTLWDTTGDDGAIEGGHSVCLAGYNAQGVQVVSWGKIYTMTWSFWAKYVDESFCVLSTDWKDKVPENSEGFAQLEADLKLIGTQNA